MFRRFVPALLLSACAMPAFAAPQGLPNIPLLNAVTNLLSPRTLPALGQLPALSALSGGGGGSLLGLGSLPALPVVLPDLSRSLPATQLLEGLGGYESILLLNRVLVPIVGPLNLPVVSPIFSNTGN